MTNFFFGVEKWRRSGGRCVLLSSSGGSQKCLLGVMKVTQVAIRWKSDVCMMGMLERRSMEGGGRYGFILFSIQGSLNLFSQKNLVVSKIGTGFPQLAR